MEGRKEKKGKKEAYDGEEKEKKLSYINFREPFCFPSISPLSSLLFATDDDRAHLGESLSDEKEGGGERGKRSPREKREEKQSEGRGPRLRGSMSLLTSFSLLFLSPDGALVTVKRGRKKTFSRRREERPKPARLHATPSLFLSSAGGKGGTPAKGGEKGSRDVPFDVPSFVVSGSTSSLEKGRKKEFASEKGEGKEECDGTLGPYSHTASMLAFTASARKGGSGGKEKGGKKNNPEGKGRKRKRTYDNVISSIFCLESRDRRQEGGRGGRRSRGGKKKEEKEKRVTRRACACVALRSIGRLPGLLSLDNKGLGGGGGERKRQKGRKGGGKKGKS